MIFQHWKGALSTWQTSRRAIAPLTQRRLHSCRKKPLEKHSTIIGKVEKSQVKTFLEQHKFKSRHAQLTRRSC